MPANQSTSRIQNQREILETLLYEGDMSRTDLARRLGLSKPAVAENVERLVQAGLVRDVGEGKATNKGGRKPRLISFHRGHQYIVGADLSFRYPVFAIGDLSGTVLLQTRLETGVENDPETRISAFFNAIYRLMSAAKVEKWMLGAIVLCVPGNYDQATDTFYTNPHFSKWTGLNLHKRLEEVFQIPVIVKNDMNAAVLASLSMGSGRGTKNLAYVSCGTSLGAGFAFDGSLYEGTRGTAGDLDYYIDRSLYQRGCRLDEVVCIDGLLRQIIADINNNAASELVTAIYLQRRALKFENIVNAYLQGDEYVAAKIRAIGEELGFVLNNIAILLDLDLIVLGGEYTVFFDTLESEIVRILERCCPHPPLLKASSLGEHIGLCGGLLLARDYLLSRLDL